MKLYSVTTIAKEFNGCKDVRISWFRTDPPSPPRPYAGLIVDYRPDDEMAAYGRGAIDELFAEDEAAALKNYLDSRYSDAGTTSIAEKPLPLANDIMGIRAIAIGGGTSWYLLDKQPNYPLPFGVSGFFDLRHLKLADESGSVYHPRLLVWDRATGKLRQETNDEAALHDRQRPHLRDWRD